MLREYAPTIALGVVTAVLMYLVFKDLRSVHSELAALSNLAHLEPVTKVDPTVTVSPAREDDPSPKKTKAATRN
jgi:hypothetical protein